MRIRIQEASRNAYPCGSGSETLILYYRRVDKRAITLGYFVQLLFDSWCRLKEKQKREREAQVVKQRREERRGTPGTPPARGKKRTERPAEETNSSIVKVTQNIVSRISLVEMVLIWSTPSFLHPSGQCFGSETGSGFRGLLDPDSESRSGSKVLKINRKILNHHKIVLLFKTLYPVGTGIVIYQFT